LERKTEEDEQEVKDAINEIEEAVQGEYDDPSASLEEINSFVERE
jgi:hypothetical protein